VPGEQIVQLLVASSGAADPAAQSMQVEDPFAALYFPRSQGAQGAAPPVDQNPAVQFGQFTICDQLPPTSEYSARIE